MRNRELAAAYVLGELDPAARAEVERRLGEEAELRAEVEVLRPLVGRLGDLPAEAWPEPDPAADSDPPPAPEPAPTSTPARAPRRRWSVRPALALGALVAVLLIGGAGGALLAGEGDSRSQPQPQLTLEALPSTPDAHGLVAMPTAADMVLEVSDLPRTGQGEYYELWLLGEDGETVPVASFRVGAGGKAKLRVPLPVDPGAYRYFDVSRQRAADGTQHSSDSVLRGPTSPS